MSGTIDGSVLDLPGTGKFLLVGEVFPCAGTTTLGPPARTDVRRDTAAKASAARMALSSAEIG